MEKSKKRKLVFKIYFRITTKYFKHQGQVIILIKIGSFGRVKLALNKTTKKYYALKILKKAEIIKLK